MITLNAGYIIGAREHALARGINKGGYRGFWLSG